MINTLPKPVLIALLYRLTILHLASRILPTIGADTWESEDGVDNGWADRPVRTPIVFTQVSLMFALQTSMFAHVLLTYRQLIFVTVYSHLLCMSLLIFRPLVPHPVLQYWTIRLKYGGDG